MCNSNNSQKAHVAHKPALSRRNTLVPKISIVASNKRPGLQRAVTSPRLASSLGRKRTIVEHTRAGASEIGDADDEMATSFLQFCAFCEKQIVVPNHSILYCSERCRRKDIGDSADSSLPLSPKRSPPLDPLPNNASSPIIRPREPSTLVTLGSKPAVLHAAKSDLDPTEWKPASSGGDDRGGGGGGGEEPGALPRIMSALAISEDCGASLNVDARVRPTSLASSSYRAERPTQHVRGGSSSAALSYLAQFHRMPDALAFTPRASYVPKLSGVAKTAPGSFAGMRPVRGAAEDSVGSSNTSVSESSPGTPKESFAREHAAARDEREMGGVMICGGSGNSLKSLAMAVEARDEEGFELVGGVWMADGNKQGKTAKGDAKDKLKKLLGEF